MLDPDPPPPLPPSFLDPDPLPPPLADADNAPSPAARLTLTFRCDPEEAEPDLEPEVDGDFPFPPSPPARKLPFASLEHLISRWWMGKAAADAAAAAAPVSNIGPD